MRHLGIDYGRARIGLAISDPTGSLAQPLTILNNGPGVMEEIKKLVLSYQVGKIVIGLPLNMDGKEGEMVRETREFASSLQKVTGLPVDTMDERLSSWEAHSIMKEAGLNRRKRSKLADKVAATIILQRYLERQRNVAGS